MKNWIKFALPVGFMLGIGHCCTHGKLLNFNNLRLAKSINTLITSNTTPSVSQGVKGQDAPLSEVNKVEKGILDSLKTLPQQDGYIEINWQLLAQTKFKPIREDSLDGLIILFPTFPKIMKALEGKKVMMKGYVIPIEETGDAQVLVLSANSYTTCFFCGKAGPESVMDIRLKNPQKMRRFKQDEKVAFRGTLVLNDKDYDYFNYILKDAEYFK